MRYFVGLGSNIEPERHIALMVRALLQLSPIVHMGRVVRTEPVGVVGLPFLNTVAAISCAFTPADLKTHFNAIEAGLGRDRTGPDSKTKSRTADLDILFALDEGTPRMSGELLPAESYVRPMLLELLGAVGVAVDAEAPGQAPGVRLTIDGAVFGEEPVALAIFAGRVSVAPLGDVAVRTGALRM